MAAVMQASITGMSGVHIKMQVVTRGAVPHPGCRKSDVVDHDCSSAARVCPPFWGMGVTTSMRQLFGTFSRRLDPGMAHQKQALITGITGQDGSYLAELLLEKGYRVHGIKRRASSFNTTRIDHLYEDPHERGQGPEQSPSLVLHYGDLTDSTNLIRVIEQVQPDEIYNLGAQSHVAVSFESPEYTANSDALGPLRILEAVRLLGLTAKTRVYQASTSELYGLVQEIPQTETTPFYPRSPYAVAKLYGYWITVNYREAYGMYACNGILFNHESPRRGETFVTRKITRGLARIDAGLDQCLYMGNLDSLRDWGHARDYVEMQWRMLQQDQPEDFVIATGRQVTVRRFVELSAQQLGWGALEWQGHGVEEVGLRSDTGAVVVRVDPRYFRPTEVETLLGDPRKAREKLGWTPTTTLEELVAEMMVSDQQEAAKEAVLKQQGFNVVGSMESPPSSGLNPAHNKSLVVS